MAKHIESYIDSSIETPKNLPSNILATLKILEEFDKRQDAVAVVYFDKLDDLWVLAKNAMAANVMTKTDWETIEKKYWVHADEVFNKENWNENL